MLPETNNDTDYKKHFKLNYLDTLDRLNKLDKFYIYLHTVWNGEQNKDKDQIKTYISVRLNGMYNHKDLHVDKIYLAPEAFNDATKGWCFRDASCLLEFSFDKSADNSKEKFKSLIEGGQFDELFKYPVKIINVFSMDKPKPLTMLVKLNKFQLAKYVEDCQKQRSQNPTEKTFRRP